MVRININVKTNCRFLIGHNDVCVRVCGWVNDRLGEVLCPTQVEKQDKVKGMHLCQFNTKEAIILLVSCHNHTMILRLCYTILRFLLFIHRGENRTCKR